MEIETLLEDVGLLMSKAPTAEGDVLVKAKMKEVMEYINSPDALIPSDVLKVLSQPARKSVLIAFCALATQMIDDKFESNYAKLEAVEKAEGEDS